MASLGNLARSYLHLHVLSAASPLLIQFVRFCVSHCPGKVTERLTKDRRSVEHLSCRKGPGQKAKHRLDLYPSSFPASKQLGPSMASYSLDTSDD